MANLDVERGRALVRCLVPDKQRLQPVLEPNELIMAIVLGGEDKGFGVDGVRGIVWQVRRWGPVVVR